MHVLNLSPSVSLQYEVRDKIWLRKNISYDHLCVFGCKTYVKSQHCMFLCYDLDGADYRFYDCDMKKLIGC